MTPRTLFAWIVIILLVSAGAFFTYHIVDVASGNDSNGMGVNGQGVNSTGFIRSPVTPHNGLATTSMPVPEESVHYYEPLDMIPEPPKQMPVVVGQSEEDLRATRQVSETPPAVEYSPPEAADPMETVVNSESEFGDNLRHPEQTIEIAPPIGSLRMVAAGIGSDEREIPPITSHTTGVHYSPEMAQNGGEFMSGIMAFDGSDVGSGTGIGYSMI